MTTLDSTIKYFHFTSANIMVKGLLTGLLYGFLVYLATLLVFPLNHGPVIWSANAFPVAILLFNRNKHWPVILFFCLIGLLISVLPAIRYNLYPQLVVYGGNLFEIFFLATIIRKVTGTRPTRKKLKAIITTALWASAVVIMIFSLLMVLLFPKGPENINLLEATARIFTSAYLGQTLLLPAILYGIVLKRPAFSKIFRTKFIELTLMLSALVIVIAVTLISLNSQTPIYYDFPFVTFPLLIWSAIRFDIRFTVGCSIITGLFTKYIASLGYISFGSAALSPYQQITVMNVGLIALNVSVLVLAIIVSDYRQVKKL